MEYKRYTRGLVSAPVKLQSEGVKRLVEDALWTQGVRSKSDPNKKRHEFQTDHGFRKLKTRCELSKVNSLHTEILMNHSTPHRPDDRIPGLSLPCVGPDNLWKSETFNDIITKAVEYYKKDNDILANDKYFC
ncbi:MAG: hypothetical protein WA667_27000 [Candidatus Nitrosopolaris sp.]